MRRSDQSDHGGSSYTGNVTWWRSVGAASARRSDLTTEGPPALGSHGMAKRRSRHLEFGIWNMESLENMKLQPPKLISVLLVVLSCSSTRAEVASASQSLDQLAPLVDQVLSEQLERLKTYVETGSPSTQ